ncbi:MAG: hypothetical protein E6L09_12985 [Verrucomicrobia bacterium]|nr:MAG: hypothetical protein E6L09_12985 [Verrucomicrobiota bacterium]
MAPYRQSDTAKFTASFCLCAGTSGAVAESRLEKIPPSSSTDNNTMTVRKSISFHGFADNIDRRYPFPVNVTMEKVVRGQLSAGHRRAGYN